MQGVPQAAVFEYKPIAPDTVSRLLLLPPSVFWSNSDDLKYDIPGELLTF